MLNVKNLSYLEKAKAIKQAKTDAKKQKDLDYINTINELEERILSLAKINRIVRYELNYEETPTRVITCDAGADIYGKYWLRVRVEKKDSSYRFNDISFKEDRGIEISFGFYKDEAYQYFLHYLPKFEEYVYSKIDEEYENLK
jgi:hypothetical protein